MTAEPLSRLERKQRTKRALLDAALELLQDRGFGGLSLREVTKHAGVVPTAFYRHFASMEELGVSLVEESMRALRGTLRMARDHQRSSGDIIRTSVHTLYEHVCAQEAHFRFLTRERYGGTWTVRRVIAAELKLFSSDLAIDMARFDHLREWSTEDLHMLADLIVSAMFSAVIELVETERDNEVDERILRTAEKQLRLIMLGIPQWKSAG